MAQGKMPEAGAAAGARGDRARPQAPPSAYGGIEAGRLVLLAKPLPSGAAAGYYQYQPFAIVRFQDLPEEIRRQIAGSSGGHGAAATPLHTNAAPVAAPMRGEGDARLPVDVVPEGHGHRRHLPGVVPEPDEDRTVKFSRDAGNEYSERGILRLMEEGGKVVVRLNASRLQVLQGLGDSDMEGSLFEKEKGFSHAWMGHSGAGGEVCAGGPKYKVVVPNDISELSNMATQRAAHAYLGAFYDNGLPAREDAAPVIALLHGNNHIVGPRALDCCSDGLSSPREDAVPPFVEALVGNGRATKQGVYYYDVLVPPAGEALRAWHSPTYAVQVSVDAAAGGKAGDPIAAGIKAGGAGAGHEHGGNLSAVLGIVIASSAATALAAGTLGPATAFGVFAALVGGLSLAMASVRYL